MSSPRKSRKANNRQSHRKSEEPDNLPVARPEVYRKEDTARLEEMYLKLQTGISNGDPRYIDAGVRVLAHKAKLNGYAAEPDQLGTASSFQIQINLGDTHEDDE